LGALNGLMIVRGRIPPFVATLAMMAIARGLTLVYTEGRPIAGLGRGVDCRSAGENLRGGRIRAATLPISCSGWTPVSRRR